MVTVVTRDSDDKILLFPKPDEVEREPFRVDRDVWRLTGPMLASYVVTRAEEAVEIRHKLDDCTALVALLEDGTELADVISRLARPRLRTTGTLTPLHDQLHARSPAPGRAGVLLSAISGHRRRETRHDNRSDHQAADDIGRTR